MSEKLGLGWEKATTVQIVELLSCDFVCCLNAGHDALVW